MPSFNAQDFQYFVQRGGHTRHLFNIRGVGVGVGVVVGVRGPVRISKAKVLLSYGRLMHPPCSASRCLSSLTS